MTSEFYSRYRDRSEYHPARDLNEIGDLQRAIVQGVIRSNSRLKLSRILEFVREQLEE